MSTTSFAGFAGPILGDGLGLNLPGEEVRPGKWMDLRLSLALKMSILPKDGC